jgi:predicted phage terminase large subunit-like protein
MLIDANKVRASLYRESFFEFFKGMWPQVVAEELEVNWHIRYVCDELQALAERVFRGLDKVNDLVINISPGTSKSTIASVMFPPWTWTRDRTMRHLCGSYSYPLALDLSRKSRDVVTSDLYKSLFPEVQLRADQNTKGYFQTTEGGYRYSFGVNGSVTGFHGHFIVVDDPLDPNQAASDLDRASANRWIEETLSSRKVSKSVSATALIMQRLHQDDPTALFLKRGGVRHVRLPARDDGTVKPKYLRKYYKGGLMDPKRLSQEVLDEARKTSEYYLASQFMQSPIPREGGLFKVTELVISSNVPAKFKQVVRAWDKAGSTQRRSPWTVGIKIGLDKDDRVWVLDVKRFQLNSYQREAEIKKTALEDGRGVKVVLEQEPGSGGKESAQNTVRNLHGFNVVVVKVGEADGDKEMRAQPFSSQVNGGNVYLARHGWNKEYVQELAFFPFGTYKDQVDASSLGYNFLAGKSRRAGSIKSRTKIEELIHQK